jgi:hypothetical protein
VFSPIPHKRYLAIPALPFFLNDFGNVEATVGFFEDVEPSAGLDFPAVVCNNTTVVQVLKLEGKVDAHVHQRLFQFIQVVDRLRGVLQVVPRNNMQVDFVLVVLDFCEHPAELHQAFKLMNHANVRVGEHNVGCTPEVIAEEVFVRHAVLVVFQNYFVG